MRVASLESAVAAVTLITAIVVVLWEIKIFYGLGTGRMPWSSTTKHPFRGGGSLPFNRSKAR